MAAKTLGKSGPRALLFLPVVLGVVSFFAAIPWLRHQDDTLVMAVTAAWSIFVMLYSLFLSNRLQRRLDEVEIASQGFATTRGWTWGAIATVLLLMLPPIANRLIDAANLLGTGSTETSDRDAVRLALFFGFMLLLLVQLAAVFIAAAIWQRRMSTGQAPS